MLATSLITLVVAGFVAAAPILEDRDLPNPSQVFINNITYGGSGCPQNSVGQFLSEDRSTFTLIFDAFTASIGGGAVPSDKSKFCQINLDMHYPQGFQYSILQTTFRGYVDIEKGVTGRQSALYYFSGPDSSQVSINRVFRGPDTRNYKIDEAVGIETVVWSKCGANWPLNIASQVSLTSTNKSATGLLTSDTIDGHVHFVTGVQWRRCT